MTQQTLSRPDGSSTSPGRRSGRSRSSGAGAGAQGGPTARRLRPPSWRDPRLLVGLLLVLASVVAGAQVVRAADDTVPVLVARHALTPGDALGTEDVSVAHVRLGGGESAYLSGRHAVPAGRVLLRAVGAGELVPAAAVGSRDDVDLRPVTVPVDPEAAAGLGAGALVDVWVAARDPGRADTYGPPKQVATNALVSARTERSGALGTSSGTAVRLLLSPALVPAVIQAVDNQARITLVPVPATLDRSGS
jgi:hypothetical protein